VPDHQARRDHDGMGMMMHCTTMPGAMHHDESRLDRL
jgi:hypothetical protein